jgi:RNA polymerase sigma factor (sigma-70 family)
MTKYNPDFWEVPVDPVIINNLISQSSIFYHDHDEKDEETKFRKKKLRNEAVKQIKIIISTRLTKIQREIIHLYYFKNKTQTEIAAILNISQQVVSKHLFGVIRNGKKIGGALKKIKKICEQQDIDPKNWV